MNFVVSRKRMSVTENKRPCEEARERKLTPLDYRTVHSLEEAKGKIWYNEWLAGGVNHREEDGIVVCDRKEAKRVWVVELNSLEELMAFQDKYGEVVISDAAPYKEARKEITIL
jgi:hypothetical protein